ncbi:MAG: TetR family transcriptional regulator [Myxococcota bacterium]
MSQVEYTRAFSDSQKQARRDAIMGAARSLYANRRYDEVTMAAIAREAGVGKGTVFFYFGTKEALFLACARLEIEAFFFDLERGLAEVPNPSGRDVVLDALGKAIAAHPGMTRLLGLVHSVLEHNVTFEAALEFRRALIPLLARVGAQCERHLTFLTPGQGARLLLRVHAMALGFAQLADPSPTLRKVQEQPGMAFYAVDFQSALLDTVELVLRGARERSIA